MIENGGAAAVHLTAAEIAEIDCALDRFSGNDSRNEGRKKDVVLATKLFLDRSEVRSAGSVYDAVRRTWTPPWDGSKQIWWTCTISTEPAAASLLWRK